MPIQQLSIRQHGRLVPFLDLVWTKRIQDSKEILKDSMDCVLCTYESCIRSSLAQRSFERFFPQFTVRFAATSGWEGGREVVLEAIVCFSFILRWFSLFLGSLC